jgi:cytochrome b561
MNLQADGFSTTARMFHWGIALIVFLMIPVGMIMIQQGLSRPVQDTLFIFHKNTGLTILILVALRLVYRWRNPPPPLPADLPGWQRLAAKSSHAALYALLLLMPIAGYVRVRAGGFPIEGLDAMGVGTLVPRSDALAETALRVHYFGALAIGALILLHISAAAYHAVIRRDDVFWSMWPPFNRQHGAGKYATADRQD